MTQNEELGIEHEIESMTKKAELMATKETQIQKFLETSLAKETSRDNSVVVTRLHQKKEFDAMLSELALEKEENPELLEFHLMFEDMRDTFIESTKKEKKLRQAYNEITTGTGKKNP